MSQDSPEVTIEKIIPVDGEGLRVVVFIPNSNYQAQKLAMEAFFDTVARDLKLKVKGPPKKDGLSCK